MLNDFTWVPFSLVDKQTLSERSNLAMSTLSNWRKTRSERIRYLEYSAYFNLMSWSEREKLINDSDLSLVKLLFQLSADKKKITQAAIKHITGESDRTLRSWWHTQPDKRAVCLELVLA